MAKLLKLRRGTTTQHASFTGAEGELTIDITKDTAVVHDGATQAGRPLLREDMANLPAGTIDNADVNASAAIAGTKISPNFGSQSILTTGGCDTGNLTVTGQVVARKSQEPQIVLQDADSGNTGNAAETGISFRDGGGTQQGMVGFHNSGDQDLYVDTATTGGRINFRVGGSTTQLEIPSGGINVTGNIGVSGTVDGRDVAADGTKLDGIESGSTGDQTAAEIRTLVESASDSNVFTDADHTKLNGIESGATADQTKSDIDGLSINADQVDGVHASSFVRNDSGNQLVAGNFTVGSGVSSYIYMVDSDHGNRTIHNNSDQIGFLKQDGNWGAHLDDSGNWTAVGNVTAYSDQKLKTNVNTINDALSIVGKLRGVSFDWKESGKHSIGVIAQEVEEVLPELVVTNRTTVPNTGETTEIKSVDYGKIVGVLINAINELKAEIDELKGGK